MKSFPNNNMSERLQGAYRARTKTLRGLDSLESGQRFDSFTASYNHFRDHESLGDRRPGDAAEINTPFRRWTDVVNSASKKKGREPDEPRMYPYQGVFLGRNGKVRKELRTVGNRKKHAVLDAPQKFPYQASFMERDGKTVRKAVLDVANKQTGRARPSVAPSCVSPPRVVSYQSEAALCGCRGREGRAQAA